MSQTTGGLRHEPPYWHTFNTHAKQRWYGRRILDVLVEEFRDRTKHYYTWAIHKGLLTINGETVTPSYIVQNGDLLTHTAHKHEPPITSDPVRILHRDDMQGTLVVVKPGSVPVHPAGRYMRHTLLELIKSDFGIEKVHTANRLDRLTSGIMVASTTVESAKKIGAAFQAGRVRKSYVCRVQGRFPEQETVCEAPLLSLDRQTGVVISHPSGRESKTIFNRISYDAETDTSVVFCRPITGRTHQIRVHVQLLGYPIPNDPLYNHPIWQEHPVTSLASLAVPSTSHQPEAQVGSSAIANAATTKYLCEQTVCATIIEHLKNAKDEGEDYSRLKDEVRFAEWNHREGWDDGETVTGVNSAPAQGAQFSEGKEAADDHDLGYCDQCYLPLLPDPPVDSLFIYLHAIRYETDEWSYEDEMPWWSQDNWKDPDAIDLARQKRAKGESVRPPQLKLFSEREAMGNAIGAPGAADSKRQEASQSELTEAWQKLLRLSDPAEVSDQQIEYQMLMDFPCKRIVSDGSDSTNDNLPFVLETFRGIEDYTLRDVRNRLGTQGREAFRGIKTAVHSSVLLLPPCLDSFVSTNALPFASTKHIYLASKSMPEDLLDQFLADRKALGTIKLSTKNRHEKKAQQKAKKGKDAPVDVASEGGRTDLSMPRAEDSPSPAAVRRASDGLVESESQLFRMIQNLWCDNSDTIVKTIRQWERRMNLSDRSWTFRTTVDRSAYQFPTLITTQIERHLAELVWQTLNGTIAPEETPKYAVSLTHPDLNIELNFIPWLGSSQQQDGNTATVSKRMINSKGEIKNNLSQAWENNPPGSLVLTIEFNNDQQGSAAQLYPHRPQVDAGLTDGGTSFARFRAYSLASLLPLRSNHSGPVKIWEPCVGTGSIAIELAAALQERGLVGDVFASDLESDDIASAKEISKNSHWPDGESQDEITVHYRQLDLRDTSSAAQWIGIESLDAILTDLPWGRRVLSHGALQVLYLDFVQACILFLKPQSYALALTLEHKTLQRAVRDAENLVRRRGGKWKMQVEPMYLDNDERCTALQEMVNRQGKRQADEQQGVRLVEMGLRPSLCLLRKVPL
ncbi:unnamed protein product [Sympodiomycopsis kandeliae]